MNGFRAWRQRLRFGLPTILGLDQRAFLIPYRYAGTLPPAGSRAAYAPIEAVFEQHREDFKARLDDIDSLRTELLAIGNHPAPAPRWGQDWFPRLDGAAAYMMVRQHAPSQIIEVGSGHSTRFFARAAETGGLATAITAIDPAPRAALDGLTTVQILRKTVHDATMIPFASLSAGDILAVDSSHILMPGSDVDFLLNHVLPSLATGVLVHIHDVFLPDDYPATWAWRGYNEQLGVAPLLSSGSWQPLFASHFVATKMTAALADTVIAQLPLPEGAYESSLWLKKR